MVRGALRKIMDELEEPNVMGQNKVEDPKDVKDQVVIPREDLGKMVDTANELINLLKKIVAGNLSSSGEAGKQLLLSAYAKYDEKFPGWDALITKSEFFFTAHIFCLFCNLIVW